MSNLLRNLLSDVGMTPEDHARAKAKSGGGRLIMPKQSVKKGPELDRVIALPRRVWEEDGERLAEKLTGYLRFPGGPNPYPGGPPLPPGSQKLRPVQAAALRDAHDMKGMFGPIRVGGGKTLISLLACVVLGAKRPLLLVPAKLIEKTRRETFALKKHWLIPGYVRLLSYEMLGREQSAETLEEHDPDLIIADECFPYDTKVLTDIGEVPIGAVVDRGVGERVLSRSEDGTLAWKRIVRRMPRAFKSALVKVTHEHGEFVCTPEHKIWTERGYVEAGALDGGDRLSLLPEDVARRDTRSENGGLLRSPLQHNASHVEAGSEGGTRRATDEARIEDVRDVSDRLQRPTFRGKEEALLQRAVCRTRPQGVGSHDASLCECEDLRGAEGHQETLQPRAHAHEQPHARPGGAGEDVEGAEGTHVLGARREWAAYETAADARGRDGAADGARDSDGAGARTLQEPTAVLQGRPGGCRDEDCDRGGWQQPQDAQVEVHRQAQDRGARVSRVVRVEVLEREGVERARCGRGGDSRLYDLEVEDNHNYFADGVLVSNCHKLANRSAAVTRRVGRYLEAHEDARFIAMSGTVTKRSIRDYAHIVKWCLRELNPTPRDFNTLMEWSLVLDESSRVNDNKLAPGALIELCNTEEREKDYPLDPVRTIRRAFRRRLVETPGVVATQEGALGTSLRIDQIVTTMPDIKDAVIGLRRDWVRPDGEVCIDAIEQWRHLREVACGFFYRWNPAPPQEWLMARRSWAKFVRDILRNNRSGIDSELQVQRAVDRGEYHPGILNDWRAVRDTFSINTEAVWLSDGVLKTAEKWMKDEKGIVWIEHTEFGHELERRTGVPFYWRQGQDKKGRAIEDHPVGTPLIASIAANGEGRNLQAWSTNFIVSCPTTGRVLEQLVGRTHRDGQEADEVIVTLSVVLREQIKAFDRARADARYISDTTGQEQKLCYADIDVVAQQDAP